MTQNAAKIQTVLEASPLAAEVKRQFSDRLTNEGATKEVVEAIKQAIRSQLAKKLLSLPSIVGSQDPEIKAANRKFSKEMRAATAKFLGELKQINEQAHMLENDVKSDLARIEELVVKTVTPEA